MLNPRQALALVLTSLTLCNGVDAAAASVSLADAPLFAANTVPANVALVLSVEYPTAISVANLGNYDHASTYFGYFDAAKCYTYIYAKENSYFQPAGLGAGSSKHDCNGKWSGNFMNWAATQTVDPFRSALTGGYRSQDDTGVTILEKAWGAAQGSVNQNFPLRGTTQTQGTGAGPGTGQYIDPKLLPNVMPMSSWGSLTTRIWGQGNAMVFTADTNNSQISADSTPVPSASITDWQNATDTASTSAIYQVRIRVKVCDESASAGGLEANCVRYGNKYKPEGLIQQYTDRIRFAALGYLNGNGRYQQGGVLRAPMNFIGPSYMLPHSATAIKNTVGPVEWSTVDGTMPANPDAASAKDGGGVVNSGVMNYINKFGSISRSYMDTDNVSELYYAALRYLENLGNVSMWTNNVNDTAEPTNKAKLLDGFPALTKWSDPVQYSCQRNYILGIGDTNYHVDYNVGGSKWLGRGMAYGGSRVAPPEITADTLNKASDWTNEMFVLEGVPFMVDTPWSSFMTDWPDTSYFIAGLAYGAHTRDIRPDMAGKQTITTHWMDVMEFRAARWENPFWLAAKYGGFKVPENYVEGSKLDRTWWNTGNDTLQLVNNVSGLNTNPTYATAPRPDNYYLAGSANQMISGLKKAFLNIASDSVKSGTAFALSSPQVSSAGSASYASTYNAKDWSGAVTASNFTLTKSGPVLEQRWDTNSATSALALQLAGTGWTTNRRIVTFDDTNTIRRGVPFRYSKIPGYGMSLNQSNLLRTTYPSSNINDQFYYLNYLRGDKSGEVGPQATGMNAYRARSAPLGDIVNSKVTPVSSPNQIFSNSANPGYAKFKKDNANRPTVAYVGANDGMLHALNGSFTDTVAGVGPGAEVFAYVPSALFAGPNGTPQVDGLAALGNPSYDHRYYVDATPLAFDIDFNNAGGRRTTSSDSTSDWHTVLIGGLGKGGRSFYAIDVTDPATMTSEALVAAKVLWEFSDPTMGFSFGAPTVVKTEKYGWVVVLTSGYNSNGGYLYFVDPKTGALLEKVPTGAASNGLAHANAFVRDYSDGTADAIYAGDLDGQVWRFDITGTKTFPDATLLATLTDSTGTNAQPITTQPLIEIDPNSRKRYVLVATGRLLNLDDAKSSQPNAFYALLDGEASKFNTALDLPTGVKFPITRSTLVPLTDSELKTDVALKSSSMGWYLDLGIDSASGNAWRVTIPLATDSGAVAFAASVASGSTDPCVDPSGSSRTYVIDFGSGKSILDRSYWAAPAGSTVAGLSILSAGTGIGGVRQVVAGYDKGAPDSTPLPNSVKRTRLLNWREVLKVN